MLLKVNPAQPEPDVIRRAADVIRQGGLVAFPTETVYGLGADALNPEAVARIFAVKRRPFFDPLIVHIAHLGDLERVVRALPANARMLAERFWPGPLTLVLPRANALPTEVTAGLETVAVRMPAHPIALALIRAAGTPIAAPSANLFGHVSPTTAQHVLDDLGEQVDVILDGGSTSIGLESTVLDLSGEQPVILRPGGVSWEALCDVLHEVAVSASARRRGPGEGIPSPGLLERHYAPRAALTLFRGTGAAPLLAMKDHVDQLLAAGRKVGLLVVSEDRAVFRDYPVLIEDLGCGEDLESVAARLFAALRALERQGAEVILARSFGSAGLGMAIEDRLAKAAGGHVIDVE